jgi:hypothetical protein
MFHAPGIITVFRPESMRISGRLFIENERPDLRPAFLGDEVYTPSPRRSEGRRANLGSLSGPRREQNLSANPKRTAKTLRSLYETARLRIWFKKFSIIFCSSRNHLFLRCFC